MIPHRFIRFLDVDLDEVSEKRSDYLLKGIGVNLPARGDLSGWDKVFLTSPFEIAPFFTLATRKFVVGSCNGPILLSYLGIHSDPLGFFSIVGGERVDSETDFRRISDDFWEGYKEVVSGRRRGILDVISRLGGLYYLLVRASKEKGSVLRSDPSELSWGGKQICVSNFGEIRSFTQKIDQIDPINVDDMEFLKNCRSCISPNDLVIVNLTSRSPRRSKSMLEEIGQLFHRQKVNILYVSNTPLKGSKKQGMFFYLKRYDVFND